MSDVVFERVSCQYVGAPRPAISGFDLTVADGELLVLCGATESGKSTVLRMLAGLVPPTDGRILVNGVDIAVGEPPHVGLVFQNYALYPNLTVEQNIGLPLTQAGEAKRTVSERVARALWAIRWKVGELLGWDDPDSGLGSRVSTLRDRLPADLRDGPSGPEAGLAVATRPTLPATRPPRHGRKGGLMEPAPGMG